jgi:DUF4097 and DUF4098 domain-containing protein YvlB
LRKEDEVMKARLAWVVVLFAGLMMAGVEASAASGLDLKGKFERTFQVTGAANLDVVTGSGDITVRTGDASTVVVKGIIHVGRMEADAEQILSDLEQHPPIVQSGNSIRIGHQEGGERWRHVSIDYELAVPAGSEFKARTGSGDLSITGPLGAVDAQTGSGDVAIESVKGSVRLMSGSGDVRMKEAGASGADVQTGSGDVLVALPSQGGFDLAVQTGSGDVSTATGLTIESWKSSYGSFTGKVRGGGARYAIRTGSGDVRIE